MRHRRFLALLIGFSAGWFAARRRLALNGRTGAAHDGVHADVDPTTARPSSRKHEAPEAADTEIGVRRPLAFAGLALMFGLPAFLLLPEAAARPPATPASKISVMVDRPRVTGTVVLNMTSAEPNRPVRANLDMWFALPAGQKVRWLVTTDPGWPIIGAVKDRSKGLMATGDFAGQGTTSPLRGDSPDVRSAEGSGALESIPLTLPDSVFRIQGSRVSLVPPRVDIGDWKSDYSETTETTSLLLPKGAWYSPAGTVGIMAPSALNKYRAEVANPAALGPGWWQKEKYLTVSWLGADPLAEAANEQHLFIAGLLFGLAGGSFVAALQEVRFRRRS